MKKSKLSSLVGIITIIYIFSFVVGEISLLVCTIQKSVSVAVFLTSSLSWTISLILLLGLNNAMKRIDAVEELLMRKKVIKKQEIEDLEAGEPTEEVVFCKKCGYQLFEDDKECPMCHTKEIN